jgi:hypothetical protein
MLARLEEVLEDLNHAPVGTQGAVIALNPWGMNCELSPK